MKMFIILGALALSLPAIATQDKNYQYKDLSSKNARPLNGISDLDVARQKVKMDERNIQKQEDILEKDKARLKYLEGKNDKKFK